MNFDQLYEALESGVVTIAKDSLNDYINQAAADGQNALASMKDDLQHWATEVESGDMDKEDLEFLLKAEEGLEEMTALKEAGLAAVHIDEFRNSIINMILNTVTGLIKV